MPNKFMRPCNQPGCPELTNEQYCEAHQKQSRQQKDKERGSAAQRGYGARWRKYREVYLRRHPLCACSECQLLPMPLPAEVVDHIIPHKGDYDLFWDADNHQPMAKRCHDKKTVREDGGFGRQAKGQM